MGAAWGSVSETDGWAGLAVRFVNKNMETQHARTGRSRFSGALIMNNYGKCELKFARHLP